MTYLISSYPLSVRGSTRTLSTTFISVLINEKTINHIYVITITTRSHHPSEASPLPRNGGSHKVCTCGHERSSCRALCTGSGGALQALMLEPTMARGIRERARGGRLASGWRRGVGRRCGHPPPPLTPQLLSTECARRSASLRSPPRRSSSRSGSRCSR